MAGLFDRFANRLTLRTQSTLLAVLVCAATVGVTATTSAWIARREAVELTRGQLATLAAAMAEQLDLGMFERFREIRNVARLSLVRSSWTGDTLAAREVLEQLQSTLPDYAWIGFADLQGAVRAATGGLLEGASVVERPWYAAGRSGMTVQDVHPAKLLAEKLGPTDDGEPFRLVDVAAPVLGANGALVGVLGAHLSWSWASDLRRQLLRPVGASAAVDLWVLAADGSVLLGPGLDQHPFSADLLADLKHDGRAELIDETGAEPMLTTLVATRGLAPYPGLGWTVVARQPLSVAMAPADRLFWSILGVGSLAILLGAACAWRAASGVTEPMRRLVRSADRVGRDASVRSLARVGGSRDVVVLSSALRSLLRRLGSAQEQAEAAQRARQAFEDQASAVQRRLAEQLDAARHLAELDPLTGLLNRRGFGLYASDAWQTWLRHRRPLAVLVVDVDHFKAINDRYGHSVGDSVLTTLGAIIGESVRATDKAARFGGEEFVALLRDTDREGAMILAERLRLAVEQGLAADASFEQSVTVSVGVAPARDDDRDLADVIERADRALYSAKLSGRNRVALDEGVPLRAGAA